MPIYFRPRKMTSADALRRFAPASVGGWVFTHSTHRPAAGSRSTIRRRNGSADTVDLLLIYEVTDGLIQRFHVVRD